MPLAARLSVGVQYMHELEKRMRDEILDKAIKELDRENNLSPEVRIDSMN